MLYLLLSFLFSFLFWLGFSWVGFNIGRRPIRKHKIAMRKLSERIEYCLDIGQLDRGEIARWRDTLDYMGGELDQYTEQLPKN